jgi:hypothetical protein
MQHIDWIKKSNINLVRINLKYDTFLSDIELVGARLIKIKDDFLVRYKIGKKIFWYSVFIHKISNGFYHFSIINKIEDDKYRTSLNRKYTIYNREDKLNQLLN